MDTSKQIKITAAIIFAIFIIAVPVLADMWVIEPGFVGIGKSDPNNPLEIVHNIENDVGNAFKIDLTLGGTISGGDKRNAGILVNISGDSFFGDSYPIILGTKNILSLQGDGLVAYGTSNNISNDGTQQVVNGIGSYNGVSNDNTGNIQYGFGDVSEIVNKDAGTISIGIGQYSVIYQESSTGAIGQGLGFYSSLRNPSGGAFFDGTLYSGEYLGSFPEKWGIYLTGEDKNYFSGSVGIGTEPAPGLILDVIGDVRIEGKLTHSGSADPPFVLYNYETRQSIIDRVMDEIPPDKLGGGVLFFNGEISQMELFIPNKGEFRGLGGEILEIVQPITETFETEDRYYFDDKTGKVKKYKVKKVNTAEKKHKIKENHFLDHKTGKFYKKIRNEKGIATDEIEVTMAEALEE
jgi:hypothetical protein